MYLTETHQQIREMTRKFADEVIRPQAEELDREERFAAEIYQQMGSWGCSVSPFRKSTAASDWMRWPMPW